MEFCCWRESLHDSGYLNPGLQLWTLRSFETSTTFHSAYLTSEQHPGHVPLQLHLIHWVRTGGQERFLVDERNALRSLGFSRRLGNADVLHPFQPCIYYPARVALDRARRDALGEILGSGELARSVRPLGLHYGESDRGILTLVSLVETASIPEDRPLPGYTYVAKQELDQFSWDFLSRNLLDRLPEILWGPQPRNLVDA